MIHRAVAAVVLPSGHTGSSLFHQLLSEAVTRFPDELGGARLPATAGAFKSTYGQALARFEALRVGSKTRAEIARFLHTRTQAELRFGSAESSVPLSAHLDDKAQAPKFEQAHFTGTAGLAVEVPLAGRSYRGQALRELGDDLFRAHQLSAAARTALHWIVDYAAERGECIDLRGERFVLLGAGAELAPTHLLLQAGARVLWIDPADPFRSLVRPNELAGTLERAADATDLLAQPREIAAAIRAFAAEGPVHIGMYAYAPGASQEWRLTAAMNAIVGSLEPELVRSVALLISPTTASSVSDENVQDAAHRYAHGPIWQRVLERLGALKHPGHHAHGSARIALSTVSVQGASYQAAQYLSKIMAAESYALFGTGRSDAAPPAVSANVAGITRTRSLSHPLFELAFSGADKFGVRIFEPATTRALNGLLMLHDLLNPEAPGAATTRAEPAAKASALFSQQVHGGIYSLPFALEGVIRAAALVGLATRPALLFGKPARAAQEPTLTGAPAE